MIEFAGKVLRRGTIFLFVVWLAACEPNPNHQDRNAPSEPRTHGDILRRGLPGEPRTLDPYLADDTFSVQVVRDLYEGLTSENKHGGIEGGVSSSWTVDATGTIYTFELRENAKWSNGDRVTADQFVAGLRHAVDPKTASGSAALLSVVKNASEIFSGKRSVDELGIYANGLTTVRIVLEHPAPYVLHVLAQPVASPFHVSKALKPEGKDAAFTNGPYNLSKRLAGAYIDLVRAPTYWDSEHVAISHVRYVNVESESTELHEYLAGQLDLTFSLPIPDLKRIGIALPKELQLAPILTTQYLAIDMTEPPLGNAKKIREALSISIDRDGIAKNVIPGVTPAYSFVAQGVTGYSSPEYKWASWPREQKIAMARSLLSQSGYTNKKPLHLKLYFNSSESIQRMMVAIATEWNKNFGIESELISDEFRVFLEGRKNRAKWDITRLAWSADYDDPNTFLEVFAAGSTQNDSGYQNPMFNELLDKAKVEPSPSARIELLRKSEQLLLDDYPLIPIYYYNARRLVKPYLGGAEITPMNATYSKHLFWKDH